MSLSKAHAEGDAVPELPWDRLLFGFAVNMGFIVDPILAAHLTHETLIHRARGADGIPPRRFLASYILLFLGFAICFSAAYATFGALTLPPYAQAWSRLLPLLFFFALGFVLLALGPRRIRQVLSAFQPDASQGSGIQV